MDRHFANGNVIPDAIAVGLIRIRRTGPDVRSYLNGDDLAILLFSLTDGDTPSSKLELVGAPERCTVKSLATLVADVANILSNVRPSILRTRAHLIRSPHSISAKRLHAGA